MRAKLAKIQASEYVGTAETCEYYFVNTNYNHTKTARVMKAWGKASSDTHGRRLWLNVKTDMSS